MTHPTPSQDQVDSMSEIPAGIREAAANALNVAEDMPGTLFSDRVDVIAKAMHAERQAERARCNEIVRAAWGHNLSIETLDWAASKPTPSPSEVEATEARLFEEHARGEAK